MGVAVEVSLFLCDVSVPYKYTCIPPYTLLVVKSRKPALFFNLLNKLYVWVDKVLMVMKLYHVDLL